MLVNVLVSRPKRARLNIVSRPTNEQVLISTREFGKIGYDRDSIAIIGLNQFSRNREDMHATSHAIRLASGKQSHKRVSRDIKQSCLEAVVLREYPLSES